MKIKFKRFSSRARIPQKATPVSACYAAFSSRSVTLEPGVTRLIEIDFRLKFSKKYVARLYPRSRISLKLVFLGGSVLDSDFRGNISIILTNHSQRVIEIETVDRIAQIIFFKKEDADFVEVDEFDVKSYRGIKGFGSTGK